jgi:glyoxylase-like metal-dependent hydrolase (beta-lactamase superfamily II)
VHRQETRAGTGHWTQPALDEVASGVFRIPLPLPNDDLQAVNVYALRSDDGQLTLIDSGWAIPEAREQLVRMLDTLGHSPADVSRFLVTHHHRDHYTLGLALRREFGTKVALGAGERDTVALLVNPSHAPFVRELGRLRALGAGVLIDQLGAGSTADAGGGDQMDWPNEWLAPGTVHGGGRRLDVVPTPGHTRGHVVFHDVAGELLFAGDHVLPAITPSIGLEPVLSNNPLSDFLDSLALVRSRPDAMLLPAHGPVTASVHARVDDLIAHHGKRLDDTEAAVLAGASTAYDIACQLKWTRRERSMAELDLFNRILATAETGAHLELLLAQGRLGMVAHDDINHYGASKRAS